ncbi:flagellar biosynthetic protein FliR [uncultured Amnibacterium sp.]|uniref:flagellar biosynthetic protein FliR n=1 Tax=uncultured Amnibacterium sp. TaxID=1631851 RepID=UPI0035CB189C
MNLVGGVVLNEVFVEAAMLAAVRITAFLVIAPPFSFSGIPLRVKGMLAVTLSILVAPQAAQGLPASMDTGAFIVSLVSQLVIGALLGFMVFLVFSAIQSAGSLIDLFAGFQMSQAFDPLMQVNGAQLTRLMQMVALGLLFVSGGAELVLAGLFRTFTALPVTGFLAQDAGERLLPGLAQMFVAAVQIAGPIVVVLFLADVGLGLLTRVAPALNAFSLGFVLKILITLLAGGAVFLALPRIVEALLEDALQVMGSIT